MKQKSLVVFDQRNTMRCYLCGRKGIHNAVAVRKINGKEISLCQIAYQGYVFNHSGCRKKGDPIYGRKDVDKKEDTKKKKKVQSTLF